MSLEKFPVPTLDRPFGVELWPIFVKAYSAVMGYSPTDFKFVPSVTPMSTLKETVITLGAYYAIVLGGRELMRNRKPFVINGLFMLHNFYLTVISAILLALFIEQLLPTIFRNGIFFAVCDHKGGWTKELVILYYVWRLKVPLSLLGS
jgi:GNS1/SUR4 family